MRGHSKALELPFIPLLNAETESIDLAELGGLALDTRLNVPGTDVGDFIHIHWRGRTALGQAVDIVERSQVMDLDDQKRVVYSIPNRIMQDLDGGDVFYSFALDGPGGAPAEESLRLAFRVNRPVGVLPLGIAQVRQAHELWIAVEDLKGAPATVVVPPFQAMAEGVEVTLRWQGYFGEGDPFVPYEPPYKLQAKDVGKPVVWSLPWDQIAILEDGFAELSYRIVHANGNATESDWQRYEIVKAMPPVGPLSPAPGIKGHSGGSLDPDRYPDGIEVIIPVDPDAPLKLGDQLALYFEGGEQVVYTVRVDQTTLDSQYMAIHDQRWVSDKNNVGKPFSISYGYAGKGRARHSQPLELALRRPLFLPWPIVKDAEPDGDDNQGVVYPIDIRSGFEVRIPEAAVIEGGDVKLILKGHETLEFPPTVGEARLFKVPPSAIPANLNKRVFITYTVTPPGEWPHESEEYDLRFADFGIGSYPRLQNAQVRNGQLSFAEVKDPEGTVFTLGSWPFMAEGDCLPIEATYDGIAEPWAMRAPRVTQEEYEAGKVEGKLPYRFLSDMRKKGLKRFRVQPSLSYDDGATFRNFIFADIDLVD
ncbi:hypothetical protein [Pseudomonas sp.]|uniref:hypothetical protein n=1 Tax=Pseudomonas sp. TaxID=306 RepID=UPI001B0AC8CE|nr:hypothetical protein [Pseudomonas sp.]MBO9549826.1 hypothetical protein [Pseudomonas sp.]